MATSGAPSGTVIYGSRMHLGLMSNFQVMPGAEWLKLRCKHVPGRYDHMVRHLGVMPIGQEVRSSDRFWP